MEIYTRKIDFGFQRNTNKMTSDIFLLRGVFLSEYVTDRC